MNCLAALLATILTLSGGSAFALGASSSAANEAARAYAECVKAMNAECVIEKSDIDRFNKLSSPPKSNYVHAQKAIYGELQQRGIKYLRFDVESPWPEFSAQGVVYCFIPYISQLSGLREVRSYLVGVSENGGKTWKIFDGSHIVAENIQKVIPGYAGQALPQSYSTRQTTPTP